MSGNPGFRDKGVVITGGLGFIGSNLAIRLVDEGARVTIIDSLVPEYGGNRFNIRPVADRVRVNISDVRDTHSLPRVLEAQDFLFNLAGQTSHLDSMNDPETDLEINCRAQLSILEACRRHNPDVRIVFASTRQVYGRPEYLPVVATHPLSPVDVNGINKLAGEWYHLLYSRVHGIRASVLRLTNTFGPRMRVRDARQTFLGVWIRLNVAGSPFEVWDGAQLRDLAYVDDVVEALLRAATAPSAESRVFNVGGAPPISLIDLAKLIVEINGGSYEVKEFPEERRRIDIGDYYANDSAIRNVLGWEPRISLKEGLTRTLDYYRSHLGEYV